MESVPALYPFIEGSPVTVVSDRLPVVNPSTNEQIATIPNCGPDVVDAAVRAARRAYPSWSGSTPRYRSEVLLEVAARIEQYRSELAELESINAGKPITAANNEMDIIIDNWRFFAGASRQITAQAAGEYLPEHSSHVRRESLGVAALIAPWNYPLHMATWKLAPALAAGNTCVIKPSELTPLTLLRLVELCADILPVGVVNVVLGDGPTTGAALTSHAEIDVISITGDVETGRAVTRASANSLARVHLELGGNAPVIVLDDADLERASQIIATTSLYNAGQDCTAACRVIATAGVFDTLVERLDGLFAGKTVGLTANPATELGPVISTRQLGRVADAVDRGLEQGATLLRGGHRPTGVGSAYAPTLLVATDQDSDLVQREVFGPVLSVQRAIDVSTALAWANDVQYGLSASVWTRDLYTANRATRELHFGTVWINDHMPVASELPFGGFRNSGHGKDMSLDALLHYTEAKHVMAHV